MFQRAVDAPEADEFFHTDTIPHLREAHARFRGDAPSTPWLRPVPDNEVFGRWGSDEPDDSFYLD